MFRSHRRIGLDGGEIGLQARKPLRFRRRSGGGGGLSRLGRLSGRGDALADVILVAQFLGALPDDNVGSGEEAGSEQGGGGSEGKGQFHRFRTMLFEKMGKRDEFVNA